MEVKRAHPSILAPLYIQDRLCNSYYQRQADMHTKEYAYSAQVHSTLKRPAPLNVFSIGIRPDEVLRRDSRTVHKAARIASHKSNRISIGTRAGLINSISTR